MRCCSNASTSRYPSE